MFGEGDVIRTIKSLVANRSGYELMERIVLDCSNASKLGSNCARYIHVCFLCPV
jgi:hypothetical protein